MGLHDFIATIAKAFSSSLTTITNVGPKAFTGPVKDISGTAKDVTGIRKDLVETKLAEKKLEDQESLIQKATLEDVERFDAHTRRILDIIERHPPTRSPFKCLVENPYEIWAIMMVESELKTWRWQKSLLFFSSRGKNWLAKRREKAFLHKALEWSDDETIQFWSNHPEFTRSTSSRRGRPATR